MTPTAPHAQDGFTRHGHVEDRGKPGRMLRSEALAIAADGRWDPDSLRVGAEEVVWAQRQRSLELHPIATLSSRPRRYWPILLLAGVAPASTPIPEWTADGALQHPFDARPWRFSTPDLGS